MVRNALILHPSSLILQYNHLPNHPRRVMRAHPFEHYNLRITQTKGDDKMETILQALGQTILQWLQPLNASLFLVCLGLFIWLSSHAGDYGQRK